MWTARPRIRHPGGTRAVPRPAAGRCRPGRIRSVRSQSSTTSLGCVADPTRAPPGRSRTRMGSSRSTSDRARSDPCLRPGRHGDRGSAVPTSRDRGGVLGPIHLRVPCSTGCYDAVIRRDIAGSRRTLAGPAVRRPRWSQSTEHWPAWFEADSSCSTSVRPARRRPRPHRLLPGATRPPVPAGRRRGSFSGARRPGWSEPVEPFEDPLGLLVQRHELAEEQLVLVRMGRVRLVGAPHRRPWRGRRPG